MEDLTLKLRLFIDNIKKFDKPFSWCICSNVMSSQDEDFFKKNYENYLDIFNNLLSFFRKENINSQNKYLFILFIELLYETIGREIMSKKTGICYNSITLEIFHLLFIRKNEELFDLIKEKFHNYMNNLYGKLFIYSKSNKEIKMISMDYILRYEYKIYLEYIFFEDINEFMKYEEEPFNNNINYIIVDYDVDEEEEDIYA